MNLQELITALQLQDYDAVLVGTPYEFAANKPLNLYGGVDSAHTVYDCGLSNGENAYERDTVACCQDSKKNAAKVIVLEQAVRDMREELTTYANMLCANSDKDEEERIEAILTATEGLVV